jgi:hypothetical protein
LDKTNNRVGVNKTVPTVALDVTGDSLITGNSTITGNLTVDTNTLFLNASQNRVGILTTTPSTAFHVNGAAQVTTLNCTSDLTVGGRMAIGSTRVSVGSNAGITTPGTLGVAIGKFGWKVRAKDHGCRCWKLGWGFDARTGGCGTGLYIGVVYSRRLCNRNWFRGG